MKIGNRAKTGICIGLALHAVAYAIAVWPIVTRNADESTIMFIVPSTVIYFPASLLAWGVAMLPIRCLIYPWALLVFGGAWYAWIGYRIGRRQDEANKTDWFAAAVPIILVSVALMFTWALTSR